VLAFSQSDEIVAAGDNTGRIMLWHGFAAATAGLAAGCGGGGGAGNEQGSGAALMEVGGSNPGGGGGGGGGGGPDAAATVGDALPCSTLHWWGPRTSPTQLTRCSKRTWFQQPLSL
jgi:hypothetical protein